MKINGLQTNTYAAVQTPKQTQQKQETTVSKNQDTFEKSSDTVVEESVTYAPPKKLTTEQVNALKSQTQQSMLKLAEQMLGKQFEIATVVDSATGETITMEEIAKELGIGTTPEEAKQAISENGQWGVDAVATRLMDMAISLSGGDPEKASELRAAVQKGFAAVGDLDSLPQVCQDTYHETMKRFDYWEEHGSMNGYGQTEIPEEA